MKSKEKPSWKLLRFLEFGSFLILNFSANFYPIIVFCIGSICFGVPFFLRFEFSDKKAKIRRTVYSLIILTGWILVMEFYALQWFDSALGFLFLLQFQLWFEREYRRYLPIRLVMVWLNLALGCILLSGFSYVPILIVVVAITSVLIPFGNFFNREAYIAHFLKCIPFVALSLLLSVFIFPFFPRNFGNLSLNLKTKNVGYSEVVSTAGLEKLKTEGSDQVVLRLFQPSGSKESQNKGAPFEVSDIFLGLIRGKVLPKFDGENWHSDGRLSKSREDPDEQRQEKTKEIFFEALREPLNTAVLFSPYGTFFAKPKAQDTSLKTAFKTKRGEWIDFNSEGRSIRYALRVVPNDLRYLSLDAEEDQPTDESLDVPDRFKNSKMARLERKIFENANTSWEKIGKLRDFFRTEKFLVSYGEDQQHTFETGYIVRMNPIERFLFISKEGHCELFSTAAALLLRSVNIPTRLVSGFRISTSATAGVVTLYQRDAHAWIEAWVANQGWIPLDFTPRVLQAPTWWSSLRSKYDTMGAFWLKYILSFEASESYLSYNNLRLFYKSTLLSAAAAVNSVIHTYKDYKEVMVRIGSSLAFVSFLVSVVVMIWYPHLLSIRWRVRRGGILLQREKKRFERRLPKRFLNRHTEEWEFKGLTKYLMATCEDGIESKLQKWYDTYYEMRFGPNPPGEFGNKLILLKKSRLDFTDALRHPKKTLNAEK